MNPETLLEIEAEEEEEPDYTGRSWIVIGLLLIFAAILFASYNLLISKDAGEASEEVLRKIEELQTEPEIPASVVVPAEQEELPLYRQNPLMEMPVKTIDYYDYIGTIEIPVLDFTLPVMSGWDYDRLNIAPCRYVGSVYQDNLVICAHNYGPHFGSLKHLREGDQVIFTDMDGNEFTFAVLELETLRPTEVEEMKTGEWDLTLFTCTVGGATRVTVRCERISE